MSQAPLVAAGEKTSEAISDLQEFEVVVDHYEEEEELETAEKNRHQEDHHKLVKETNSKMAVEEDLEVYSLEPEKPKELGQASSHPPLVVEP